VGKMRLVHAKCWAGYIFCWRVATSYSSVHQVIGHVTSPSPCRALRGGLHAEIPCLEYYRPLIVGAVEWRPPPESGREVRTTCAMLEVRN